MLVYLVKLQFFDVSLQAGCGEEAAGGTELLDEEKRYAAQSFESRCGKYH